jgi:hypothetical protein
VVDDPVPQGVRIRGPEAGQVRSQSRRNVLVAQVIEQILKVLARSLRRGNPGLVEPGLGFAKGDEVVRNRLRDVAFAF